MEYKLGIATAVCGDVMPLIEVAEAMAEHAACGFGKLPFHNPTFRNVCSKYIAQLIDAANKGLMIVCDCEADAPEESPCIRFDDAVRLVAARLICDADRRNERAKAALNGLTDHEFISLKDGWLWRTTSTHAP
jgi:hypothetical protein